MNPQRLCWSCEQPVTSHSSAESKLWITAVLLFSISCILSFFVSSCLKNTDMGLHLLSLSNLYAARVYECYFTGIAVCVYSQSNLLLQHSIKINKWNVKNEKEILWQLLSYQKSDNTVKANGAAPIHICCKSDLKF